MSEQTTNPTTPPPKPTRGDAFLAGGMLTLAVYILGRLVADIAGGKKK